MSTISQVEIDSVTDVMLSGKLSGYIAQSGEHFYGGRMVRNFAKAVTERWKSPYCVPMNSATSCLHAAIMALRMDPGSEVICSPFTMAASASCCFSGLCIPIFADIDDKTWCLDPKSVEEKITPRTRAIVVVHQFGHPADMGGIMRLARKHSLYVIEDCAQAIDAKYKDRDVGTIGDIGVFSLNIHKHINCGEGGFCLTYDWRLRDRLAAICNHADVSAVVHPAKPMVGHNWRMGEIEAAIAIEQLEKVDELCNLRRERVREIANTLGLKLYKANYCGQHSYYNLVFNRPSCPCPGAIMDRMRPYIVAGYVKPLYKLPIYMSLSIFPNSSLPWSLNNDVEYEYEELGHTEIAQENILRIERYLDPTVPDEEMELFWHRIDDWKEATRPWNVKGYSGPRAGIP